MLEISILSNDELLFRKLSEWHQAEWGHLSDRTLPDRVREFQEQGGSTNIPLTLVAFKDNEPVGTCSLLVHDLSDVPKYDHLTPWMGSVYVLPEYRRQGIARAMCKKAVEAAKRLKVKTLYLFTPDQQVLYSGMGWEVVDNFELRGEMETLMKINP